MVEQDSLIVIMHIPGIATEFFFLAQAIEMQILFHSRDCPISFRNLSLAQELYVAVYNFSAKGQLPVCLTPSLFHRSI